MIYLPIVILLAAVLVLVYLIFRPDVETKKSKITFTSFVERCHVCKKTHVRLEDYQLDGSPVKVCDMCKEYAERRAYVRR